MYNTEGGINVGPILFADDNLNPLRLSNAEEVRPLLQLYSEYQQVSGLNINIRKSQASPLHKHVACSNCRATGTWDRNS